VWKIHDPPDSRGYFGGFGGRFVPETLIPALDELEEGFARAARDPAFEAELSRELALFGGRPTPLLPLPRLSLAWGGEIAVKREDLCHTGAHKINNAVGQALLARRLGKRRIVAETGAGQHGVAVAAACARLELACRVYMGRVDMERQAPNVDRMLRFGAEVVPVTAGQQTLKEAINEAIRDWVTNVRTTHYLLGSAVGPHPYPLLVRELQAVIGREARAQARDLWGRLPDLVAACVGGGSNAIGFFAPFLEQARPRLIGVEAGGRGTGRGEHAARMSGAGRTGIVQGYKSLFLLDEDGQVLPTHSISAGLDYPGIGPQLAHLGRTGRVEFTRAGDREALEALTFFARHEGLVFALESAHAAAAVLRLAPTLPPDRALVVNMSGRGDKDLFILASALDGPAWREFLTREAAHA
jgi:tryptophan synthase beta chain